MKSIRSSYETVGVHGFYVAGKYKNPHASIVQELVREKCQHYTSVIDLACGNGEVTLALPEQCKVMGIDPYLNQRYKEATGKTCLSYRFDMLAARMPPMDVYDAVICSFALHLAGKSVLPDLLYNLSLVAKELVVIGPSKMPVIEHWAWRLEEHEVRRRVHFRRYQPTRPEF